MDLNVVSIQNFGNRVPIRKADTRILVPLSEYKGKLLELTESDLLKIKDLEELKENMVYGHYRLSNIISNSPKVSRGKIRQKDDMQMCLDSLRSQIRDIKIQRHKAQMAETENL